MQALPPIRPPAQRICRRWPRYAAGAAACWVLSAPAAVGEVDGLSGGPKPSAPLTVTAAAMPQKVDAPATAATAQTLVTVFTPAYLDAADAIAGLILPPPTQAADRSAPAAPSGPPQTAVTPAAKPAQLAPGQDCAPRAQDYPAEALRARATGVTRLRIAVDAAGQAAKIDIVRPAGPTRAHAALDEQAARRLVVCRFEPARDRQGRPMRADFEAEVVWTLP